MNDYGKDALNQLRQFGDHFLPWLPGPQYIDLKTALLCVSKQLRDQIYSNDDH